MGGSTATKSDPDFAKNDGDRARGERLTIRWRQWTHFGVRWNLIQRGPNLGSDFVQPRVPVLVDELSCGDPICNISTLGAAARARNEH